MDNSFFEALRGKNRKHFHEIWEKARHDEFQDLNDEEQRLGRIMLDHSDEYFNQFEFADALAEHEYAPESEVNPFLHVTLHAITEKQVEDRNPIEAFQFYNAMRRNKCDRHEAFHLLGIVLVKFIFETLKKKIPFPLDRYRATLKEYKSRRPEKIKQVLADTQFHEEQDTGMDPRMAVFLAELRERHPHIHEGDDEDWWEEGMKLIKSRDLPAAQTKFEQLIVAEPWHHDGYEGLAMVYRSLGKKKEALLLIEYALVLAKGFFEEGDLDQEILDEIEEEKRKIQAIN